MQEQAVSEAGTAEYNEYSKEPRQSSAAPSETASYQRREQVEVRKSSKYIK